MKRETFIKTALEVLSISLGTVLFSSGIHFFTVPNQIAPGGLSGLSTIVHFLTGFPIGIFVLLVNIPLLFFGYRKLGLKYVAYTICCLSLFSLLVDRIFPLVPYLYEGETILASIFGGALIGAGLSLIFLAGGSSGGIAIVVHLLRYKYPHLPNGMLFFFFDLMVIALAAVAFGQVDAALYALISVFICAKVLDGIMYGFDTGRLIFIVSEKNHEIQKMIIRELNRGVTVLKAKGGYNNNEKDVLLCAVRMREFFVLRGIVRKIDHKAFIMAASTSDIAGEGFKTI